MFSYNGIEIPDPPAWPYEHYKDPDERYPYAIIDPSRITGEDIKQQLIHYINKNDTATVVHHETCPCCGRKLVNLYRRDIEWKCRLCWEKHDADPPTKPGSSTVKLVSGKLYKVNEDGTSTLLAEVKEETPMVRACRLIKTREEE